MSGRDDSDFRGWVRGAMLAAVIVLALVGGGLNGRLSLARVKPLQVAGLAVMVASIALSGLSKRLASRLRPSRRDGAELAFKLASVCVCAMGAMLVFIA